MANLSFLPPETESAVPATVSAAEPAAAPTTGNPAAPQDNFLAAVTANARSTISKASSAEPPTTPSPNGGELSSPAADLSPGGTGDSMLKHVPVWDEPKPSSTTTFSAAVARDSDSAAAAAAPPVCRIDVGVTLQVRTGCASCGYVCPGAAAPPGLCR